MNNQVADCIVNLYINSTDANNPWYKVEYRQGLRDALEAMKRYGDIEDYNLETGEVTHKKSRLGG